MQKTSTQQSQTASKYFPPFDLARLLRTVFDVRSGEKICMLIDLENPREVENFRFLNDPQLTVQRLAYHAFYQPLHRSVMEQLGLRGGELFAYKITGGSNLNLPDEAFSLDGQELSFRRDIYPHYDIILCLSTYSATAPLTADAKKYGFRGATLHGLNETILNTGLAVDYNEVSAAAEKLRRGMTKADRVEIDFELDRQQQHTLRLELGRQEAQKSHGIVRVGADIANLPAGEIYYVPTGAEGTFPRTLDDGTVGLMEVSGGRIQRARLVRGNKSRIDELQEKLRSDPVTGELGELGFGTQDLPPAGSDIQDEKILGTVHVATGRSDHLGGSLTPDKFADEKNATHDDILFSPTKTPDINVPEVRMYRGDEMQVLIRNYQPIYMRQLLDGEAAGDDQND